MPESRPGRAAAILDPATPERLRKDPGLQPPRILSSEKAFQVAEKLLIAAFAASYLSVMRLQESMRQQPRTSASEDTVEDRRKCRSSLEGR